MVFSCDSLADSHDRKTTANSKYISQADDHFIQLVYQMIKRDKKGIVLHTTEGKPLTPEQYKAEIDEARKQYEKGDYITQQELEQKTKNW